jgi:hypothetical protein
LSNEDRLEAEAEITSVQSQLSSTRPKINIMRSLIGTIKRILDNIPANVAANMIVANIPGLIERFSTLLQTIK